MFEITFHNKSDANKLYKCSQQYFTNDELNLFKKGNYVLSFKTTNKEIVNELLSNFILKDKRYDWLQEIISEQFYYEDENEQQQIINIVYSLFDGKRNELIPFLKDLYVEENITAIVKNILEQQRSFSFDSFVKFRLKSLLANLEKYVEIAIDEYKLEQDYQIFLQTLRDFLKGRPHKIAEINVVMTNSVTFYDSSFRTISKATIDKLIDRKLMFNYSIYIDTVLIAPLISISPERISIYTAKVDSPLIRTVKNVFEERVQVFPLSSIERNGLVMTKS